MRYPELSGTLLIRLTKLACANQKDKATCTDTRDIQDRETRNVTREPVQSFLCSDISKNFIYK